MTALGRDGTALVFVYGTLRRGFPRHVVLQMAEAQYAGKGTVQGELFDLGNYPGARPSSSPYKRVVGELYRLRNPARALRLLDRVEEYRLGNPRTSLFVREIATVDLGKGKPIRAWVYWLNRVSGPARQIITGDYTRR
jgi:gamma-glutamylcyclotransferase (GGCT)/AIG2-like uncharacterized protein YtfP